MKKSRILIPIVLAILSMHPVPTTAAQLDTWTWRNPLPTGNQLNGVTHGLINGKNLWVAVGANNTILTSPNGTTWDQRCPPAHLTAPSPALFIVHSHLISWQWERTPPPL